MARWSRPDDAKLAKLFETKKLDPTKTDKVSIHLAKKHFPDKKHENFAPLYRDKCAKWELGEELSGKRRGAKTTTKKPTATVEEKTGTIADFIDDDGEDDEDYIGDINEAADSGVEEVINEEATIETKQEKPPKKDVVEKLTGKLQNMSVQSKAFSMAFGCPCMSHNYIKAGRKMVTVEFLIPCVHRRFVRLNVRDDGLAIELATVVPPIFCDTDRVQHANAEDSTFTHDTHKATAFQKAAEAIQDTANDVDEVIGPKQCFKLPFKVETDFHKPHSDSEGWEIQLCENDDEVLHKELEGDMSDFFVLSVDVVSVVKAKGKKARGGMRKAMKVTHEDAEDPMDN